MASITIRNPDDEVKRSNLAEITRAWFGNVWDDEDTGIDIVNPWTGA